MTESPKPPPRPVLNPGSAAPADTPAATGPTPVSKGQAGPPPPPLRGSATKPAGSLGMPPAAVASTAPAAAPQRAGTGTAPLPAAAMIPPASPAAAAGSAALTREPARDTLAPSSFGVLGGAKHPGPAPAPAPVRNARGPLPTLGDLEGATATATLRPPGAVPPPPRALPMPTPTLDAGPVVETPLPGEQPFTALAGDLPPSPRAPHAQTRPAVATPQPLASATVLSAGAPAPLPAASASAPGKPTEEAALDSTLDMSGSASKKATQAALIEQTRIAGPVPAPGLYIADEPIEPRPKQASLVSVPRSALTRMRIGVLVLGGLLLMLAGALVVLIVRRSETHAARGAAPSASSRRAPPGCRLAQPPSRISPTIERSVPISAVPGDDGSIALAIADSKTSAAGWIYDAASGEAKRALTTPAGSGEVSYVSAGEPLIVDRSSTDFAFARSLATGLALGVGPAGILRRGGDGATGVVWSLPAGVKVTPPRVVAVGDGYFVAFRQGGAEGQLMTGWLKADGSARSELSAVSGAPKSLGTPNVALAGQGAIALFAARNDKSEPYRIHAARAALGQAPAPAQGLDLPAEGGGAIAPSLVALADGRFIAQWTDGNVGHYRVHARMLGADFAPLSAALLISAKGANAGQGTIVVTRGAAVSFFIQTTAGHDELWGASLSCQ